MKKNKSKSSSVRIRRKGVAIVKGRKGILLVAEKKGSYYLPGGGAEHRERRKEAAIRELKEETGLSVKSIKQIGKYTGKTFITRSGKKIKNSAKVFAVSAKGKPIPSGEIKKVAWWKPGSKLKITPGTKVLVDKFYRCKK